MKWNKIRTCKDSDKHYTRGKLYCLDFTINKRFDEFDVFYGYYVNIKNSKTKDYFNTKERWNLIFKSVEEAQQWCETYARISYYKIYDRYNNWVSKEVPVPGRKGKKYLVFRPATDKGWNECLEKEKEWDKEIANKFKNTNVEQLEDEIKKINI